MTRCRRWPFFFFFSFPWIYFFYIFYFSFLVLIGKRHLVSTCCWSKFSVTILIKLTCKFQQTNFYFYFWERKGNPTNKFKNKWLDTWILSPSPPRLPKTMCLIRYDNNFFFFWFEKITKIMWSYTYQNGRKNHVVLFI